MELFSYLKLFVSFKKSRKILYHSWCKSKYILVYLDFIHLPQNKYLLKTQRKLSIYCVKSVRIRSYSGPYFSSFGLNTEKIAMIVMNLKKFNHSYDLTEGKRDTVDIDGKSRFSHFSTRRQADEGKFIWVG